MRTAVCFIQITFCHRRIYHRYTKQPHAKRMHIDLNTYSLFANNIGTGHHRPWWVLPFVCRSSFGHNVVGFLCVCVCVLLLRLLAAVFLRHISCMLFARRLYRRITNVVAVWPLTWKMNTFVIFLPVTWQHQRHQRQGERHTHTHTHRFITQHKLSRHRYLAKRKYHMKRPLLFWLSKIFITNQ